MGKHKHDAQERAHIAEAKAAAGRKGMANRWAAHRAERMAAGLPSTVREERGRGDLYITDLEIQEFWMAQAVALGIVDQEARKLGVEQLTRTQHRRLAKLLADSETNRAAREVDDLRAPPASENAEALIAFYTAERERWHVAAERDRRHAEEHDRYAAAAELELGNLLLRRARGEG